jgi:hypothetical protein
MKRPGIPRPLRRARRALCTLVICAALASGGCGADPAPSQSQRADVIRFADLKAAAQSAATCMQNRGLRPLPPKYDIRAFTFSFAWRRSRRADASGDACVNERYEPVNQAWQEAHAGQIDALDRELRRMVIACVRRQGHDIRRLTAEAVDDLGTQAPGLRARCITRSVDQQVKVVRIALARW